MSTSFEPSPSLSSATARGISLAGVVLIVLFLTILSASLMPVRLLDAAWQLRVGGVLINASPFPLIGLVLLHFSASLDPSDALLVNRHRLAAHLAAAVAVGYLLLAPMLASANLQYQQSQALATSGGLLRATERLQQMRQMLNSARSIPELEQRMATVQGPSLDAADRSLPIPLLRSRIASLLDQASTRVERARSSAPPASPWALVGDIVRTTVACIALAAGFAGLARAPGSELSLLEELLLDWEHLLYRRSSRRWGAGRGGADSDFFRQLSEQAEAEDEPPSGRRG